MKYRIFKPADECCRSGFGTTESLKTIAHECRNNDYDIIFFCLADLDVNWGYNAVARFARVMADTHASMVYSDYRSTGSDKLIVNRRLLDLQPGSVRDDFDFGPVFALDPKTLDPLVRSIDSSLDFAAFYALRLEMMRCGKIVHVNEFLYTVEEKPGQDNGQFAYVDPRNRAAQIELEQVFTGYLRKIGAFLGAEKKEVDFACEFFETEVSVIIPVKNRVTTIATAIESVLKQRAAFTFNVIVVDNHSTDGTTHVVAGYDDPRVIHLIPERHDLGIGGCWNYAVADSRCGRFALQLDSDDTYSDNDVVQRIVDEFYRQKCAMLIGSYMLNDFDFRPLPPGIIDHSEWTDNNGANNALRINGLGAPRCFFTPLLRKYKLPDTSYGEDYAIGLRLSREYRIGRIYDVLYYCRRWHDNTDANRDYDLINTHNHYKDSLRSMEIEARVLMNQQTDGNGKHGC